MGTSKYGSGKGLLARALALGVASGMRSSLGFNAPALHDVRDVGLTLANTSRLLSIGGELIVDKLPKTPSRLTPPGLVARFVSGAAGGLQLANRVGGSPRTRVTAAVIAIAGAAGGAYGGATWRRTASGGAAGRPDWPGAIGEDAVALSLALAASR
ncbi:MAG TPA: hypothetical protein VHX15_12250 [Frankiaceae bacterium]|jgi:uncharacterized membrane protein|nr:hypothetical protein [Frankiaceae bacterium]